MYKTVKQLIEELGVIEFTRVNIAEALIYTPMEVTIVKEGLKGFRDDVIDRETDELLEAFDDQFYNPWMAVLDTLSEEE